MAAALGAMAACSSESDSPDGSSTTSTTLTGTGSGSGGGTTSTGATGGSTATGGGGVGGNVGGGNTGGGNVGGGGASGPAAAGTYILNGVTYTAIGVGCAQIPNSVYGVGATETFTPRESFTVTFESEPTAGTYDVIATHATFSPSSTECGSAVIVGGDVVYQWFAVGGGTVEVSMDGGKIHVEGTDIPLQRLHPTDPPEQGTGSINVTCD
jgi:hypothetical protein